MENKIEYPKFVKMYAVLCKDDEECMLVKVRINPMSICSYSEAPEYTIGGRVYQTTSIWAGARSFHVTMPIDKVDEMLDELDMSVSLHLDE